MPREYARKGASDYLGVIRKALLDGKQKQADSIAEKHFMGLKTKDDAVYAQEKKQWVTSVHKGTVLIQVPVLMMLHGKP